MKTTFYLDGKKTTRKAVKELVGEERLKRMLKEAKETFLEDPMVQNDFFIGSGHRVCVRLYRPAEARGWTTGLLLVLVCGSNVHNSFP